MKKYEICSKLINLKRNRTMVSCILSIDSSLDIEDLVNDLYIHHVEKNIYPNNTTINRFLQDICKKILGSKKYDGNKNKTLLDDFSDIISEPIKEGFQKEDYILLREVIEKLGDRDKIIIKLKYYQGYTNKYIGEYLGVSSEYIRQRLSVILNKIKEEFE